MTTVALPKTQLREYLDARGIRYSWVADQLGITNSHFHHMVAGRRPVSRGIAAKLAALFDVPATTFLPEDQDA